MKNVSLTKNVNNKDIEKKKIIDASRYKENIG